MTYKHYVIAAKHNAYGTECSRVFCGTAHGAIRAAERIARAAGTGWTRSVREAMWVGGDKRNVSNYSTDYYEVEVD